MMASACCLDRPSSWSANHRRAQPTRASYHDDRPHAIIETTPHAPRRTTARVPLLACPAVLARKNSTSWQSTLGRRRLGRVIKREVYVMDGACIKARGCISEAIDKRAATPRAVTRGMAGHGRRPDDRGGPAISRRAGQLPRRFCRLRPSCGAGATKASAPGNHEQECRWPRSGCHPSLFGRDAG